MTAETFYDRLARDYHLLYQDWEGTVRSQAAVLAGLIEKAGKRAGCSVLDCACGIGTQALGLSGLGYTVKGIDVSPTAIKRAGREARKRSLHSASFEAADMRKLPARFQDAFDVAIACDNPLAHLLSPSDLRIAARSIRTALKRGGVLLLSSRDYERAVADKPTDMALRHRVHAHGVTVIFQLWDWEGTEPIYLNNHFIMKKRALGWNVSHVATRMRAYRQAEITEAFEDAGFRDARWQSASETGYFQPIMTCVSPS